MKNKMFRGYQFSQLTLGTVQLGLNYGISNLAGIPGRMQSEDMLQMAVEEGINTLDTAREYGNSETILGGFMESNPDMPPVNLVSKFKINPLHLDHPERAWQEVHESVLKSLAELRVERLAVCLLHKGDEPIQKVTRVLPEIIRRLKEEGLIAIGGISAYAPKDVPWIADHEDIEATQIPLNIFDQRLVKDGSLSRLHAADKLVFARSIFLQGLFFMEPASLKGKLKGAETYLVQLKELAEKAEMSVAQLAFSFVRDLPGVSSIVFGAVNPLQISQNVALLNGKAVPKELIAEIQEVFGHVEEDIITPGRW